jgi:hypothetical protein
MDTLHKFWVVHPLFSVTKQTHDTHCFIFATMSSSPKQTPITKFTCQHHKSYVDHTPSTISTSVPDTPASAGTTNSSVFVSTPASANKNKCTPPGKGEALIRTQQIRVSTLISKLKELKATLNNKNNECSNNNNTTSVPDDKSHSSLNQSFFINEQSNI